MVNLVISTNESSIVVYYFEGGDLFIEKIIKNKRNIISLTKNYNNPYVKIYKKHFCEEYLNNNHDKKNKTILYSFVTKSNC